MKSPRSKEFIRTNRQFSPLKTETYPANSVATTPPRFGLFSAARYYAGVRASPLGSLGLRTGEFLGGEIFKGGVFRAATRGEYALQLGHQWLLDYGIDALIYSGAKGGIWTYDLATGDAPSELLWNPGQ